MYSRCCLLAQSERCFGKKPCCSFCMFSGACFRALALLMMERVKAKWKKLFSSRGCLGCYTNHNHELIIAVDEPSNGLKIQGQSVKKPSVSEDFWSTSTCEMDNSIVQSRRSISSISASNPVLDPQGCPGSVSNPSEFINHGLLLWNQTRQQWLGNKRLQSHRQGREPRISWNATYESLLATNKPFPQPVPLPEMIDFLVDIWEQEGLYD